MIHRRTYIFASGIAVLLGLLSRRQPRLLPSWAGKYPGDILWASMVYFLVLAVRPTLSVRKAFTVTVAFSTAIELLKLCKSPILVAARNSVVGGLVFGHVFTWGNLVAYAAGAAMAALVDAANRGRLR